MISCGAHRIKFILPLNIDFISENVSVANPVVHYQNSLYTQILIRFVCTYRIYLWLFTVM